MSDQGKERYKELTSELKYISESNSSVREKYIQLKRFLERICRELTLEELLQFPSLFSRIVYIAQKYKLTSGLEWQLQNIRIKGSFLLKDEQNIVSQIQYERALHHITLFVSVVYDGVVGEAIPEKAQTNNVEYYDKIRVQVVAIDRENKIITARVDSENDSELIFKYDISKVNDVFTSTIEKLWIGAQLNLINCRLSTDDELVFVPQIIVLEPDYLIDASSLAECFQNYGKSHLHFFRRKFEADSSSQYILLGNLANYFLDELIYAENPSEVKFQDVFLKTFKLYPFEFTSCKDIAAKEDFLDFMSRARTQFANIQRVVCNDFIENKIDMHRCILEPSFFCEKFGFQGRLDLLQLSTDENESIKIIELKSGGLPFPKNDPGKISLNHEAQTTIYRLIIQSVFNKQSRNISSSILYSASENNGENLRFSASYQLFEKEIVNIRNLIVANEHYLYLKDESVVENVFKEMFNLDNYGRAPQFFIDRLASMEKVLSNLTGLDKKYLFRFISFISRELYIQKVGDTEYESYTGTACLWNTEFLERKAAYDLISELQISAVRYSESDMKIVFKRIHTDSFVNFRVGDLCILYPSDGKDNNLLSTQILKGTLAKIDSESITLRFRYKQKNEDYFQKHQSWVIEHDRLDHTYNNMFKSVFSFFQTSASKRALLMGIEKPRTLHTETDIPQNLSIEEKQDYIINKAISAESYFLIVGPPGTGKTSIFAKRLIELFYEQPSTNIMVIAYTNRAVDELCEAINNALGNNDSYIRIGSELSCAEPYQNNLLQNISKKVKSRDELRTLIQKCRIFVGTLAAINGKPEIFNLKKFNVAIIDEASQILEPQIIGLLTNFDKFIMIGDHKQLSTITLQDEQKSKVVDADLNNIELLDCRESYFERVFRLCVKNGWSDVYDTLTYQGRMHKDIADIVNKYFYDDELQIICNWQKESLNREQSDFPDFISNIVANKRLAFLSIQSKNNILINDKVNDSEADIVVDLCKSILEMYKNNNLEFDEQKSLGVIAPYRNQIALIKHKLEQTNIPSLKNIMIDTVERFQGSQRDIIILSFCVNKPYQLDFLCNLNREKTVDRKLNVALTRARHQLFLVGDEFLLRQNKIYSKIIDELEVFSLQN